MGNPRSKTFMDACLQPGHDGPMPDLQRFTAAQAGTYEVALAEVRRGRKASHWMWFVFPQLAGLGRSETSRFYAIADLDEARAFLADPVLGRRLVEISRVVAALPAGRSAADVFGEIDALKLRSSMTLFAAAAPGEPAFRAVLDRYFGGATDAATERLLENGEGDVG